MYRRNCPMEPIGRVPSNFGDYEDQLYLVPSHFCNLFLLVFARHCLKLNLRAIRKETKKRSAVNGRNRGGAITGYCEEIGWKILRRSVFSLRGPLREVAPMAPWLQRHRFLVYIGLVRKRVLACLLAAGKLIGLPAR